MKNYKYILFDLDGTLTDPFEGITNSVVHALNKYGIKISDKRELACFIGPPLIESFIKYFNFTEAEAVKAVEYYREHFSSIGLFENEIYDGISDMLNALKSSGKCIIMATSKPIVFATQIAEHFNIAKYFDYMAGSELNGKRVAKCEVIEHALDELNITDREACLMVGDRHHDIDGAKKANMDSLGVLWGYGSLDELTEAGATYIAKTVDQLQNMLM